MKDEAFGSSVLLKLAPKKSPPVLGEMYVPEENGPISPEMKTTS
jgi:hypothetical protein